MTIVLNEPLSQISLLFVSAAMAFIALALVLFSLQLSKLLGQTPEERAKPSSLERIGFIVTAVQPVKGEMSTSVVKAGSREPSNLDSVVVCRRRRDGVGSSFVSREEALEGAILSLRRLQESGVPVGDGDIRSVVRGVLLAYAAANGEDLVAQAAGIDAVVNETILNF